VKRLFWLVTGIAFGVTMAVSVERAVRRKARRFTPQRIGGDLAGAAHDFVLDLRDAVAEGREAAREREAELRQRLEGRVGARP
jgi:hypothetical protein